MDYWDLFLDTGAPEAYLLYRDAQETVCKQEKAVTSGVVLRVTDTKRQTGYLTVLTPDRGKIPLIARGARRKNSRLAAACQI